MVSFNQKKKICHLLVHGGKPTQKDTKIKRFDPISGKSLDLSYASQSSAEIFDDPPKAATIKSSNSHYKPNGPGTLRPNLSIRPILGYPDAQTNSGAQLGVVPHIKIVLPSPTPKSLLIKKAQPIRPKTPD